MSNCFCLGKVTDVVHRNINRFSSNGTPMEYVNLVLNCTKVGETKHKRFGVYLGNPRNVVVHCMVANGYGDVIDEVNRYGEAAFVGDIYYIDLESYCDNGRFGIEYYPSVGSAARFENVPNADPSDFGINIEGINEHVSSAKSDCIGF